MRLEPILKNASATPFVDPVVFRAVGNVAAAHAVRPGRSTRRGAFSLTSHRRRQGVRICWIFVCSIPASTRRENQPHLLLVPTVYRVHQRLHSTSSGMVAGSPGGPGTFGAMTEIGNF